MLDSVSWPNDRSVAADGVAVSVDEASEVQVRESDATPAPHRLATALCSGIVLFLAEVGMAS